jgi:hypothetical protein
MERSEIIQKIAEVKAKQSDHFKKKKADREETEINFIRTELNQLKAQLNELGTKKDA